MIEYLKKKKYNKEYKM